MKINASPKIIILWVGLKKLALVLKVSVCQGPIYIVSPCDLIDRVPSCVILRKSEYAGGYASLLFIPITT